MSSGGGCQRSTISPPQNAKLQDLTPRVDGTASKEIYMNTVTFSAFKTNMENTIQSIFETHQPVVVKKNRRSSVVVMPLEDYQALTETKYLLNSPANAARLVRGIEEIEDLITRPPAPLFRDWKT